MLKNLTRLVPGKSRGGKGKQEAQGGQKENVTANHQHAPSGASSDAKIPHFRAYMCNNVRAWGPVPAPHAALQRPQARLARRLPPPRWPWQCAAALAAN